MTPLHVACLSSYSGAHDIICKLVEGNPLAASVTDADGLLPLDYAVSRGLPGASDIVKVLLRAYPAAAIVNESLSLLADDWHDVWAQMDPVGPACGKVDPEAAAPGTDPWESVTMRQSMIDQVPPPY
jgi:hypothetical protein